MTSRNSLRSVLRQQAVFEGGGETGIFFSPRAYMERKRELGISPSLIPYVEEDSLFRGGELNVFFIPIDFSHISYISLHIFHIFLHSSLIFLHIPTYSFLYSTYYFFIFPTNISYFHIFLQISHIFLHICSPMFLHIFRIFLHISYTRSWNFSKSHGPFSEYDGGSLKFSNWR